MNDEMNDEVTGQKASTQEPATQEAAAQEAVAQNAVTLRPRRRRRKVIAVVLGLVAVALGLCALVFYIDSLKPVPVTMPDDPNRERDMMAVSGAEAYATRSFVFKGTVLGMRELSSDEEVFDNGAPILLLLDMRIDKVYAGDGYSTGDKVCVFYPVSRKVYKRTSPLDSMTSQVGPVMEADRSFVLFCNLSADAKPDARYADLIAQSDLYVFNDLFSFPVKDGYVCVWIGWGWKAAYPPTVEMGDDESREYNTGLFSCMVMDEKIPPPVAYYYSDDDFTSAIEYLRTLESPGAQMVRMSYPYDSLS
jgi:hypothetical protein